MDRERSGRAVATVASAIVVLGLAVLIGRLYTLQVRHFAEYREIKLQQSESVLDVTSKRNTIFDAGGKVLAVSRPVDSIFAVPSEIKDVEGTVSKLSSILALPPERLRAALLGGSPHPRKFAWVKRKVGDSEAAAVRKLALPGIAMTSEYVREYPHGRTACHLIGFINSEERGQEGVEAWAEKFLSRGRERVDIQIDGTRRVVRMDDDEDDDRPRGDVVLTIDTFVQAVCEEELRKAYQEFRPKSAVLVAMNPKTGEILALVSLGDFDPNHPGEFDSAARTDRVVSDPYEPGSAIKPFIVAGALEYGVIRPDTKIECKGAIKIGSRTVHEHDNKVHGMLSAVDIIAVSCNPGAVQVGEMLGVEKTYRTLANFGFGARTRVDLTGESAGKMSPAAQWNVDMRMSIPIGHALLATPVQLAYAMGALANGGVLMHPFVVSEVVDADGNVIFKNFPRPVRRVVSPKTSEDMIKMLMEVVERGTGKEAKVQGVSTAGKTGTSQKVDPVTHKYTTARHVASFVGFAPADDPQICIAVVVDEPQTDYYGGKVSAPVFGRIVERTKHLFGSGHELSRFRRTSGN